MKIRRIKAVARKEFIQIMRDPRSLILGLAIPVLMLFLFGYALTLDVDNVPMVIWNQDNSQTSKDFILNFSNSRYFNVFAYYDNYRDLINLIDKNKTMMAMVIPKHFSRYLRQNEPAPLQVLIDGSDSNTAMIARGYIEAVVNTYNTNFVKQDLSNMGIIDPTPISFRPRIWFNPNFESRNFLIPGLIAIIMVVIAALLTSLTIAREWERGTMEQLISTPVRGAELIAGKFIPYFVIGFFDLIVALIIGVFIFRVPFRGNIFLLLMISTLFLTGALYFGIYISVTSKTQRAASQVAILATFLPTFLLSGFVYPIYNMPKIIQATTYLIQARYFIVALRGIFLKGIGMKYLWPQVLFLFVFAVLMTILANLSFKKKVA